MTARVALLVSDMLFRAKIRETARHVGVDVVAAKSAAGLVELAAAGAALVIVDLADAKVDALAAVAALKAEGAAAAVPVVGFYPHVLGGVRERAVAAGCDRVLPRSRFSATLADQLGEAAASGGADAQRLE
jgi:CheY-like chemotaxis protein